MILTTIVSCHCVSMSLAYPFLHRTSPRSFQSAHLSLPYKRLSSFRRQVSQADRAGAPKRPEVGSCLGPQLADCSVLPGQG